MGQISQGHGGDRKGKASGPNAASSDKWLLSNTGMYRAKKPTRKIILTERFENVRGVVVRLENFGGDCSLTNDAKMTIFCRET
jgi:hypothetical protein